MNNRRSRKRKFAESTILVVGLITAFETYANPVITQVNGTFDHKGSVTIQGSGFGTKPSAAPLIWDDATASDVHQIWNGAWPDQLGSYNMAYRGPMRGVNPPHSHDSRLLSGAHAANTGANAGYDVMVFKTTSLPTFPCYLYTSWYQRADSSWVFGGDNNFKTFDYSEGDGPYSAHSWYAVYGPPHPGSTSDSAQWVLETGTGLLEIDANGHNAWWGSAVNPMSGRWSKVEMSVKLTDQNNGYISIVENGREVVHYVGRTDNYSGNRRTISIGGYARMQGQPTNWRYYDDIYVDTTLARIVLADKPTLADASIIENQIPVSWQDGSVTFTVNLGHFSQGQTAYLFAFDASGNSNAVGFPVFAGGAAAATPNAPSSVSVK